MAVMGQPYNRENSESITLKRVQRCGLTEFGRRCGRTLTRIEYWDRAGGGRNMVQENSTTNEVRGGKWMRAAQKGLKMSCIHPFGHHKYDHCWKTMVLTHF